MVTKVIAIVLVSAVKRNLRSRRDGVRYQNLNLNVNVWSAKGSTALQQLCAVLVLCALKNSAGNLCWWYIKKKMFKCSMGPGLGPQGKLEGLCVGSFNNCFGKFVPFFNGSGKKAIFIYISPATSIYKFKWVVISCLAFLLPEVIWNYYCQGAI